jgi:hypothetical protein
MKKTEILKNLNRIETYVTDNRNIIFNHKGSEYVFLTEQYLLKINEGVFNTEFAKELGLSPTKDFPVDKYGKSFHHWLKEEPNEIEVKIEKQYYLKTQE